MKLLIVVALGAALLPGCSERAPAPLPAAQAPASSAPARLAHYRARLITLLAGQYRGQCSHATRVAEGAIEVTPEGLVSVSDRGQVQARFDLRAAKGMLIVGRTLGQGRVASAYAMADSKAPEWSLAIMSGKAQSATVGDQSGSTRCEPVAGAAALAGRSLYAAVAPLFVAAGTQSLACRFPGAEVRVEALLAAGAEAITVGSQRVFSVVRGVAGETLGIDDAGSGLSYSVDYADGGKLALTLGPDGRISDLIATGPGGDLVCS